MKTSLDTLKEMVDIAVAFNPGDHKIVIRNDGTYITVTRIIKKIKAVEITKEQITDVILEKAEKYPDFDISYLEELEQK